MDLTAFVAVIKRIPFFESLSPDQAKAILQGCEQRSIQSNATLCSYGDPSNELFILLSGQLSIRTQAGVQIALIEPISPVGEMGLFTGEPRSATVTTRGSCTFLVLSKIRLQTVLRRRPDIELVVSRNLIRILSERLRDANKEIAHLPSLMSDQDAGGEPAEEGEGEEDR